MWSAPAKNASAALSMRSRTRSARAWEAWNPAVTNPPTADPLKKLSRMLPVLTRGLRLDVRCRFAGLRPRPCFDRDTSEEPRTKCRLPALQDQAVLRAWFSGRRYAPRRFARTPERPHQPRPYLFG